MAQQNIKQIIKQEYIKCAKDPIYFMKKYCMIQHPTRGRIKFNLYPFQESVLKLLNKHERNIILKSRQLGISTLSAGMALWQMIFQKDTNVLVIATKQDTAKNLVTKVKFMYENLPSWLKLGFEENNKLALRLKNGSQVKAVSAASDAGRSEAISLLIIDEAAFIEENRIEEIWGSSQQTLSTGGRAIVLSTPNGTGNFFHRMWVKAEEGTNGFTPIRLPWTVHPERDEAWRIKQDDELGPRMAAQECDCDFTTSGNVVFESEMMNFIESTNICEPIERRGIEGGLHIWEYPDYTRKYMITDLISVPDLLYLKIQYQIITKEKTDTVFDAICYLIAKYPNFEVEENSIGADLINEGKDLVKKNLRTCSNCQYINSIESKFCVDCGERIG